MALRVLAKKTVQQLRQGLALWIRVAAAAYPVVSMAFALLPVAVSSSSS